MGIALQRLFRYHEDSTFLERPVGKVLLTVFFIAQGPLLLNSSSTEEPLPPMCTVRQSKAYAGPSRTKARSCSRRGWFCSMITHVHSVIHVKRAKFKWEQLDYPSCSPDMSPCDFHVFWSLEKTSEKATLQLGR